MEPLDKAAGFRIRPGLYGSNGATALPGAVNFTVHSHGAYSCELLLYHRDGATARMPVIPFPEKYRVGHVLFHDRVRSGHTGILSMPTGLDGPWDPAKGLLFDKTPAAYSIPYAKAVTGQSVWG